LEDPLQVLFNPSSLRLCRNPSTSIHDS